MQLFIVRGLRHRVVTGAIFASHRLKRLGQSAKSVSGLEAQEKEAWISVRCNYIQMFSSRNIIASPKMIGICDTCLFRYREINIGRMRERTQVISESDCEAASSRYRSAKDTVRNRR